MTDLEKIVISFEETGKLALVLVLVGAVILIGFAL